MLHNLIPYVESIKEEDARKKEQLLYKCIPYWYMELSEIIPFLYRFIEKKEYANDRYEIWFFGKKKGEIKL